ncbi:hypothetical protein CAPTEDRAFT_220169 [Capitella teleta]|uniref:SAM-dependent MTase RsmB/NOP-type domain-containing protein n=1 Tax=Capitella teleta TaxID=283909 RepID=R7TIV8_CAPTE|nr:hypothetical protein CAPTEDRAFT_220169 [Capitella teleta]|eukprot:ELT91030.1 hypothetical protein CAPTEDRAFT_220169 [Capitella teleta]
MRLDNTKTEVGGYQSSFLSPGDDHGLYADKHTGVLTIKEQSPEYLLYMKEFFEKEPCLYNHLTYKCAANIYEALRTDFACDDPVQMLLGNGAKRDMTFQENFEDEHTKRLTYRLVFQTLKYQRFLDDMLKDCHFFQRYPEFKEDYSQVMVMLCDFKERKFQPRTIHGSEDPTDIPALKSIENALLVSKTKLNAALARSRIKARVLSIDHLLPDSVRQNDKIGSNMHMYCWVNHIKTKQVLLFSLMVIRRNFVFCSSSMDDVLGHLIGIGFERVDSESKLAGRTYYLDHQCNDMICFPYEEREPLEAHFLVTDNLLVVQKLNVLCDQVFADRVKLFMEDFLEVPPYDDRLKHVKVVLLVVSCSRSGVANPVNFIVSEGEDISILRDLSLGYTDESKLSEMVVKHNSLLKHTLKFPRVQAVVYCTRSLLEAENESVVTRSIEFINTAFQLKTPFRIAPPVLPLSDRDIESENPLNGKYLRYPPSPFMSGCFVAIITREADDPKEAAKNILARAAAKGIFSMDSGPGGGEKGKKGKKTKKKKAKENSEEPVAEAANDGGVNEVSSNGHVTVANRNRQNWVATSDHITVANKSTYIQGNSKAHVTLANNNTENWHGLNNPSNIDPTNIMRYQTHVRRRLLHSSHVSPPLLNKRKKRKIMAFRGPSSRYFTANSAPTTSITEKIPDHQKIVKHPAPFR